MAPRPRNGKINVILEAARNVLVEEGYAAATINQIASRAGVSRGLLHYYFKNKEDLIIRVFRHNVEEVVQETGRIFARSDNLRDLAGGLTEALRSILAGDPRFFSLFFESWTLSRQGPEAMAMFEEFHAGFRRAIAEGLQSMAQRGAIRARPDLQAMAAVLAGIVYGVSMQVATKPELAKDASLWNAVREAIMVLSGDNGAE